MNPDVARENRELHTLRAQREAVLVAWDACTDAHPECRELASSAFQALWDAIDDMAGVAE